MTVLRWAGLLLVAGALAGGCSDTADEPSRAPTPAPPPTTSAGSQQSSGPLHSAGRVAADAPNGLTVRYLDRDGTVKTLHVEDFRR